jgi:hypothetical protein
MSARVGGASLPRTAIRRSPGRGGPPQFPPPPSEGSAPHTPRSPSRLHLQGLHRFHGLRPGFAGSALPAPTAEGWTYNDAAGFASCYGPLSRFPCKGFRHWASTPGVSPRRRQSATGLMAATRTGLPPAGDDELTTTDHRLMAATSCLLGARKIRARPGLAPRMPGRRRGAGR